MGGRVKPQPCCKIRKALCRQTTERWWKRGNERTAESRLPGTKQVSILMLGALLKALLVRRVQRAESGKRKFYPPIRWTRSHWVVNVQSEWIIAKENSCFRFFQTMTLVAAYVLSRTMLLKVFLVKLWGGDGGGERNNTQAVWRGLYRTRVQRLRLKLLQIQHWVMQMMRLAQGITCSHLERLEII